MSVSWPPTLEKEPETLADAALPDDKRPDSDARNLGTDVHVKVLVEERVLPPARRLETFWTVQRLRGHRHGWREVAGSDEALCLPEGRIPHQRMHFAKII